MFPNVRLLIGALFASVVALSCGFGVFAAFRVNHDPLSRLPAGTIALQLVVDRSAEPRPIWGVPVHAQSSAPQPVAALIDTPHPVVRATAEPAKPSTLWLATAHEASAAPQPKASPPTIPSGSARSIAPAATVTPAANVAPVAPVRPAAPITPAAFQAPAPVAPPPLATNARAEQTPQQVPTQAAPAPKQDLAARSAQPAPAAIHTVTVTEPSTQPSPPAVSADQITGSLPRSAVSGKASKTRIARPKPRKKIVRKPVERRRVVARRRPAREARAPASNPFGDQNSTFAEPTFQSAPSFDQLKAQRRTAGTITKRNGAEYAPSWPSSR